MKTSDSEPSIPRGTVFDSDPLFQRLDGNESQFGQDMLSLFKSIDGFRDAKDDRALENIIRQRLSGKVFVLENMGQSEYYNRPKALSRSIPGRHCLGQEDRESKGLNDLSQVTYADCEKLNRVWTSYAIAFMEILQKVSSSNQTSEATDSVLFAHDFLNHNLELVGATIEVVHSQNPQLVGIVGIVVRECENSFELISASKKRRIIPKDVITIRVHILGHPGLLLRGPELAGIGRTGSVHRASEKIKNRRARNSLSYS